MHNWRQINCQKLLNGHFELENIHWCKTKTVCDVCLSALYLAQISMKFVLDIHDGLRIISGDPPQIHTVDVYDVHKMNPNVLNIFKKPVPFF